METLDNKKYFIIPLILLLLILLLVSYLVFKPKIPGIKSEVKPKLLKQTELEVESEDALIVAIRIRPKITAQILNIQSTSLHLPPVLNTQPSPTTSTYIFKTTLYTQEGKVIYSSWKTFPIRKDADGSFDISFICPNQPKAILVVTDTTGTQLVSAQL